MSKPRYPERVTVALTREMLARIAPLAPPRERGGLAAWIRGAIRYRLDNDPRVTGSRAYITQAFAEALNSHDRITLWYLTLVVVLVAHIGSLLVCNLLDVNPDEYGPGELIRASLRTMERVGFRLRRDIARGIADAQRREEEESLLDGAFPGGGEA